MSMLWRTRTSALLPVFACAVALSFAGPASAAITRSPGARPAAVSQTRFAKTKFVIHVGLAFGAFKHFIYDPWKAGDFHKLFSHKIALAKAALAAVFCYHELKLAAEDAKSSKILSALFSPVTLLASKMSALKSQLSGGNYKALGGIQNDIGSVSGLASNKGQPVTPTVPSLSQLSNL
jgi:hypothetical protein